MSLEEKLGYFFFDKHHLKRALTRKSYVLEQTTGESREDQEAYSLLGSSVLDAVLTELLIRAGHSTQQAIVTQKLELKQVENLASISQDLGVGFVIKLSQAEKSQRVYDNPIVLAESLEAVIGGVYFDGGFSAARKTIHHLFQAVFPIE